MARLILLDSGPLGLIVRAPGKPQVVRCVTWLNAVMAIGATVIIPEIAHYEVRRELLVSAPSAACDAWTTLSIPAAASDT